MASLFEAALQKGAAGAKLSEEEAKVLAAPAGPEELTLIGEAARHSRQQRFGQDATYICNLHVNPSNICSGACLFCRFGVSREDESAYILNEATIMEQIVAFNPSEVHIVGGLNREWDFARCLQLVHDIRKRWPELFIKAFTAVEIAWFAESAGCRTADILARLKQAGLNALPGGGAEIFSSRLRKKLCPDKIPAEEWLAIHAEAHHMQIPTNATILYGCGETPEEQVEHLLLLREQQEKSGGFSCFIPLAYQNESGERPSPVVTLKITALARLVLDNIPHIKAYWPMIGLATASVALSWGADDLDGTLGHERIAHAAGASTPHSMARDMMEDTVRLGGFTPHERDGAFGRIGVA